MAVVLDPGGTHELCTLDSPCQARALGKPHLEQPQPLQRRRTQERGSLAGTRTEGWWHLTLVARMQGSSPAARCVHGQPRAPAAEPPAPAPSPGRGERPSPEEVARRIEATRLRRQSRPKLCCPACPASLATPRTAWEHMASCCPDLVDEAGWA